tara:strand:- start:59 stop:700 length:642 start_codon:yes stop_codon:yes gene_type:complete
VKTIDKKAYLKIIEHYNNKINIYGLTTKGLDWKSKKDNNKRFLKIYNQIKFNYQKKVSIFDFGCGLSDLFIFLKRKKLNFSYEGIDTSKKAINFCKKKFKKNKYYCLDILQKKIKLKKYDVIILNGIFTIKSSLSDKEMYLYIFTLLKKLKKLSKGIFIMNFLTSFPDWKNKKNFYPDIIKIIKFVEKNVTKDYTFSSNSDLHENILVLNLKN